MESLLSIFNSTGFMPHGMCFQWRKDILYTHVAADIATGLAYYGVAAGLIYFFMKRDDIPYKKFVIPFGILIFTACGTSHFFSIWTIWNPDFGPEAIIKATTGIVSVATTAILWYLMPQIIALPSPKLLKLKNQELEFEIGQRKIAEEKIQQLNDVREQKVKDRSLQLIYQSNHDDLTGLINRREFERRAEWLLATLRHDSNEHALCYLDLDQFKIINDTCGHNAGDEMLRQISSVLKTAMRQRDTLARLGGDEFGILMENCSLDEAHQLARSIQQAIQDYQFLWEGRSFNASVSMGLVPITITTANLTELLSAADVACYMAKNKGRNRIQLHRSEDEELSKHHGEMFWVTRINQALEDEQFCLYAQEIMPLVGSENVHYEFLIRLIDEEGKLIPPDSFLPAAERYNLITKIDRWVIETSFRLLENEPSFLHNIGFFSLNLSGQSLAEIDFQDFVIHKLTTCKLPLEKICFEITETAAISNLSMAIKFITTLKGYGCRFALDDFGCGLSSFSYLKNLPVDFLKIDGVFVKDIVDNPIDYAMVKSINEIGQVMGMQTIAEFVENDEIKERLKDIGVDYVQGSGIRKPQPLNELIGRSNKAH
jgi:diguanylate cyclase (GGDEF)-like protein